MDEPSGVGRMREQKLNVDFLYKKKGKKLKDRNLCNVGLNYSKGAFKIIL